MINFIIFGRWILESKWVDVMSYRYIFCFYFFMLSGCTSITDAPIPIVPQAVVVEPRDVSQEEYLRPMALDQVVLYMEEGATIGKNRYGTMCLFPEARVWAGSEPEVWTRGQYHNEFKKILKDNGYKFPENSSDSLFGHYESTGDELIVRAKVTEVNENFCSATDADLLGNVKGKKYKGSASFSVYWEIYSILDEKVVFKVKSLGSAKGVNFKPLGEHKYFKKAFGNALRNLLSNEGLLLILTTPPNLEKQKDFL